MLKKPVCTLFVLALLVGFAGIAFADSWAMPKRQRYCSADGQYCLEVEPKPIESQLRYFDDHVKNADNPGAGSGKPRTASATLLSRVGVEYTRVRSFPLLNEVAPVSALVSADGRYFVTFDNWHSMGYGDDVVVLYRGDGTVIRKYSLVQLLSEKRVASLPHTVSSIWWSGTHRLDEKRGELVLQVAAEGSQAFDENRKYSELRLSLSSGEIVRK